MTDVRPYRERLDAVPARTQLSFVVPCYNEQGAIDEMVSQLCRFADELPDFDTEFVFVDDGSTDATRAHLKIHVQRDPRVRLIGFARNFGHQIAVSAGIDAARGDILVLIDADLQDPPALVREMIARWRDGYDVVYAQRTFRDGESAFKRWSARAFYRILNRLSDVPIPLDTGDFRLISRAVADTIRAMPERDRFIRGMVSWVGFKQTAVPYQRARRFAGTSKYPLRKMLRFATDGILSFSAKPLRLSVGMGAFSAALALLGIIYALVLRIFTSIWVEGWTALMLAILFLGGVQLICMGILGEYIGRIYNEVKQRPLYVVAEREGFPVDGNRRNGKGQPEKQ